MYVCIRKRKCVCTASPANRRACVLMRGQVNQVWDGDGVGMGAILKRDQDLKKNGEVHLSHSPRYSADILVAMGGCRHFRV